MVPPAPARLSTTTCCPRLSPIGRPSSRPMMSFGLAPGGNGTTRRTGRLGYACACACSALSSAQHSTHTLHQDGGRKAEDGRMTLMLRMIAEESRPFVSYGRWVQSLFTTHDSRCSEWAD